MLRGINYATGKEQVIPGWVERFVEFLFETLSGEKPSPPKVSEVDNGTGGIK